MAQHNAQPDSVACWCGGPLSIRCFTADAGQLGRHEVVRCSQCGVYALSPQPDDATLARAYASEYYGSDRQKFVGPVARAIAYFQGGRARRVASHLPKGARVLDVGCGNGGFAMQLAAAGYQVQATELSAESAARVPAESGVTVHVGDLLTLDLPEQSFDAVTLWHVLEHVRDPQATLQKAARLLKPGGLLMMEVPNHGSMQAGAFGPYWLHLDPPRHLFGFTPQSLRGLCEQVGFDMERTRTLSLEQGPFGVAQSVLNRLGLPRDRAYEQLKGTADTGFLLKLLDLAMLGLLALPSLLWALAETACGRGAVVNITARKPA